MLKPFLHKKLLEAGCDEAGRGCLAGPVVAAAVILPKNFKNNLLNDSKKLTKKQRYELRKIIEEEAVSYGVAFVDNHKIDEINILNASILAMHNALDKLTLQPEFILVDGNKFKPYKNIQHTCVVKGDGKYLSIAAASILAKTYRDDFMLKIHEEFPHFDWKQNKGYPTKKHREILIQKGVTPYHRKSFKLKEMQLSLSF
ncbi:MAG: ribonuclease HII [Vicingaceae bacterium]